MAVKEEEINVIYQDEPQPEKYVLDASTRVLFVCSGNTCRSPMCAALFNHKFKDTGAKAYSAGLMTSGSPISEYAVEALEKYGVENTPQNNYKAHVSRTVSEEDIRDSSVVVAATSSHAFRLIMMYPAYASKIMSFQHDLEDPFGGGPEIYEKCLEDIDSMLSDGFN